MAQPRESLLDVAVLAFRFMTLVTAELFVFSFQRITGGGMVKRFSGGEIIE